MRILLVEDDLKIAQFVKKGLEAAGFVVDHAAEGEDAAALLSCTTYDLAVMDLMLPGVDGLTIITRLREKGARLPVIILSAKHSVDDRVRGLQQGGDDYLVKPFALSELLARIHVLLRRTTARQSEPTRLVVGPITFDFMKREVYREGRRIDLHARELALLECFMRSPERVLSKSLILERVWNYNFDPQTNAVDVLVCRLRNKIDKGFQTKTIHTIRGLGYVFRPV